MNKWFTRVNQKLQRVGIDWEYNSVWHRDLKMMSIGGKQTKNSTRPLTQRRGEASRMNLIYCQWHGLTDTQQGVIASYTRMKEWRGITVLRVKLGQ